MSEEKNCCQIPYKLCSIIICCMGMLFTILLLVLIFTIPDVVNKLYNFGTDRDVVIIAGCIICTAFVLFNIFLAVGLYLNSPCLLLVWLVGNVILWIKFLVIFFASGILTITRKKDTKESTGVIILRIIIFIAAHVVWMILIIMVGRHWYLLCEEIMLEEYPERRMVPSFRQRMRTWSAWSRPPQSVRRHRAPSLVSTRMPILMERMTKDTHRTSSPHSNVGGGFSKERDREVPRDHSNERTSGGRRAPSVRIAPSERSPRPS